MRPNVFWATSLVTLLFAVSASAAPITLQYNITGGQTIGLNAIGAITGGTLVVHFPNTGSAAPPIAGPASIPTLTLVGTAGTYVFPRLLYDANAQAYPGFFSFFTPIYPTLSYFGANLISGARRL